MKKKSSRIVALVLTLCMVFFGLPVTAMAANVSVSDENALKEAFAAGGTVTLAGDITMSNSLVVNGGKNIILDLAGHKLTYDSASGGVFLNITSGALTVRDSEGNGAVVISASSTKARGVQVYADSSFRLESGTISNEYLDYGASPTIANYGTVTIAGGTVKGVTAIFNFAPILGGVTGWNTKKAVCTISGGSVQGVPCTTAEGVDQKNIGSNYGICIYGPGFTSVGVDNSLVTLNITKGTITAGQAIGTNASSGKYAGFSINMTGGTVNGGNDGTGMYLPAVGITNVSGGTVTGAQGIRICAGELNVTGGEIICTEISDNTDLIAGGSGGTTGAIVVGKAGNGYVGDIDVNISEDAVIQNTATADGIKPTIVVSDKNMADNTKQDMKDKDGKIVGTFQYSASHTNVTVDGAEISGDVVKISNLTSGTTTSDGGQTSLVLNDAAVSGDVINQTSSTSLEVNGGSVVGDVTNINGGSVKVDKVTVSGDVTNSGKGSVSILDSTVEGTVSKEENSGSVTMIGGTAGSVVGNVTQVGAVEEGKVVSSSGKNYNNLADALREVQEGETLFLGAGTFIATADNQFRIDKKNVTLRGRGADETTINASTFSCSGQGGVFVTADNVTIEGVSITSSAESGNVAAVKFTPGTQGTLIEKGTLRNVTLSSEHGHGANIHGVNGMLIDGVKVVEAGKLSISVASSPLVTIQNTKTAATTWGEGRWDVGIMHADNSADYTKVSHVVFGEGNTFANDGNFYSEYSGGSLDSAVGQFTFADPDKLVYRDPDARDPDAYEYTTQTPPAALIRDGEDPLAYNDLESALAAAENDDTVQISGEQEGNFVVEDGITLLGAEDAAISGSLQIAADGVEVHQVDLSGADVTLNEGMQADLSYNYWGGKPAGIDGATVYPYYKDSTMTNPVGQGGSTTTPSDDAPSLGYRLPYIGESTGGKNFVSDTTGNLTVNGKYQFRITSTDGHKPVMTVSNSNFTVELASRSGNDYFYVIRCAGAAGSTANVLVDGIHVVTATVGTAGVVSDTTHPFTVAQGAAYQFKLTSASRPTFTGNNANFTIAYVSNSGNDWFFKVTAAGAAGASTTFSANGVVVTTATIA